jgi:hypothetical protein
MWTINFIEAVSERDIDLLLLEEFTVNAGFRAWFVETAVDKLSGASFIGAFHSISDARLGESDIVLGFDHADTKRCAVLLENKIDAAFQPDQAERYHRRGEEGVRQGTWTEFITCIVAPQAFLKNQSGAEEFDTSVSYERLVEWFDQQREEVERNCYRAAVLRYAAEKTRRKAIGKAVPEVTAFWAGYWQLACNEFPELQMPRPGGKGPGADWPDFRGNGLPPGTHILHKLADGKVDLELSGMADLEDEVRRTATQFLPDDASIEVTGKSLAVRLMVPPLDRWQLFDAQIDAARSGLAAVKRLVNIGPTFLSKSGVLNLRQGTVRATL